MAWIPQYINKIFNYKAHQTLSAKELNAALNLIVTQGDYNSGWLDYLTKEGIPAAVAALSLDVIKNVVSETVREEIDALGASVVNKTSLNLNRPIVSFLDVGTFADTIPEFKDICTANGVVGSITVNITTAGASSAYPTINQLIAARNAGFDIITCGITNSPITDASMAQNVVDRVNSWATKNLFEEASQIFVYPEGTNTQEVKDVIRANFLGAINILEPPGVINPQAFSKDSICVLPIDVEHAISSPEYRAYVEQVIAKYYWCIFCVDTSSSAFSTSVLADAINYVKSKKLDVVKVSEACTEVSTTIYNSLADLNARVYKLEDQMVKALAQISDEVNARIEDIADVNQSYAYLTDKVTKLIDTSIDLHTEIGSLESEVTTLKRTTSTLTDAVSQNQRSISTVSKTASDNAKAVSTINKNVTVNGVPFIFDVQNGKQGWNTSPDRGADTFHPFRAELESDEYIVKRLKVDIPIDTDPNSNYWIDLKPVLPDWESYQASDFISKFNSIQFVNTAGSEQYQLEIHSGSIFTEYENGMLSIKPKSHVKLIGQRQVSEWQPDGSYITRYEPYLAGYLNAQIMVDIWVKVKK